MVTPYYILILQANVLVLSIVWQQGISQFLQNESHQGQTLSNSTWSGSHQIADMGHMVTKREVSGVGGRFQHYKVRLPRRSQNTRAQVAVVAPLDHMRAPGSQQFGLRQNFR